MFNTAISLAQMLSYTVLASFNLEYGIPLFPLTLSNITLFKSEN